MAIPIFHDTYKNRTEKWMLMTTLWYGLFSLPYLHAVYTIDDALSNIKNTFESNAFTLSSGSANTITNTTTTAKATTTTKQKLNQIMVVIIVRNVMCCPFANTIQHRMYVKLFTMFTFCFTIYNYHSAHTHTHIYMFKFQPVQIFSNWFVFFLVFFLVSFSFICICWYVVYTYETKINKQIDIIFCEGLLCAYTLTTPCWQNKNKTMLINPTDPKWEMHTIGTYKNVQQFTILVSLAKQNQSKPNTSAGIQSIGCTEKIVLFATIEMYQIGFVTVCMCACVCCACVNQSWGTFEKMTRTELSKLRIHIHIHMHSTSDRMKCQNHVHIHFCAYVCGHVC